MIQGIVLKHPAVDVVFDNFYLVSAKAMAVVFPSHQLVEHGGELSGVLSEAVTAAAEVRASKTRGRPFG